MNEGLWATEAAPSHHPFVNLAQKQWLPSLPAQGKPLCSPCQQKHTDWNHPPWPGTIVTICVSYFKTGGPGKEHGTNKPPPTGRVWERSKGDTTHPTTSQNPPLWNPSWLSNVCATSKNPESGWLAKDNPETNPVIIKLQATRQSSSLGFPTLLFSARAPLPNKVSCFVSTCVSSDNSFPSVRQERTLRPWKGSPFLQQPQALAQLFPIWLFPHCLSPLPSPLLLSSCCFSSGWLTQPPDNSPCTPALFSPAFLIYLLCTRCRIHKSQLLSCSSHI